MRESPHIHPSLDDLRDVTDCDQFVEIVEEMMSGQVLQVRSGSGQAAPSRLRSQVQAMAYSCLQHRPSLIVRFLGLFGGEANLHAVHSVLQSTESKTEILACIEAIMAIGGPKAVELLAEYADHLDPEIALSAAVAFDDLQASGLVDASKGHVPLPSTGTNPAAMQTRVTIAKPT